MMRNRRSFTDEFKREAVALLESSGRPLAQVAKELDLQPSALRNWRRCTAGPKAQMRGRCVRRQQVLERIPGALLPTRRGRPAALDAAPQGQP